MSYPYKPDKVVQVQNWSIRFFIKDGIAICHRYGTNMTYVISDRTETIDYLPQYVQKELEKRIFLKTWRAKKIHESLKRLSRIEAKILEMQKKRD